MSWAGGLLRAAGPPGLLFVREPYELGVERAHPELALGVWLIEFVEANGHVAADDDRSPSRAEETIGHRQSALL